MLTVSVRYNRVSRESPGLAHPISLVDRQTLPGAKALGYHEGKSEAITCVVAVDRRLAKKVLPTNRSPWTILGSQSWPTFLLPLHPGRSLPLAKERLVSASLVVAGGGKTLVLE